MMVPDLEPFLPRIRALFPDTRGHGLSSRFERPEDYTYPRKAEDMLLWIDALGVTTAVWGGASMGAALSLWLAAHHGDRVRAVVSISGPPYAPTVEDRQWWAAHRHLIELIGVEFAQESRIRDLRVIPVHGEVSKLHPDAGGKRCQQDQSRGRERTEPHYYLRSSMGAQGCPSGGPTYSARGRIRRLLRYCSRMCAVHPEMRLTAKIGVNKSIGIPST